MKKILLSAVSLAVLTGSAIAADLPSRKEAVLPPPPPPMWQGMYAGLNAGYNWGVNTNSYSQNWGAGTGQIPGVTPLAPIAMDGVASNTQSGFIGGAQFGYNYQYGSNIVLGVETDIQGTNTRGTGRTSGAVNDGPYSYTSGNYNLTAQGSTVGATTIQGGVDYIGTVRGRIGYLWSPALLVYGTGGFAYGGAWANVGQLASSAGSVTGGPLGTLSGSSLWVGGGQQNQLLTGWTAGAGAEWMFMPNWSLKGEALYWDLGRMNVNTASYMSTGDTLGWGRTSVNYSGVMARAGINYHFNFAAPVVAKF